MNRCKRFAVVGVGQRAQHFITSLLDDHAHHAQLVGLCDTNFSAAKAWQARWGEKAAGVPLFAPADLERMLDEQRVDTLLVMTPDHTHDEYICRAMEVGCDVVTEKPLTTTAEKCQRIIDTAARTGRTCRVAFNYRYAPWNSTIKRTLISGAIGRPTSVSLRHTLGHEHGAYYFHRWHAEWEKSGGLQVHKTTHFVDLINWWIGSVPQRVYARGYQSIFTAEHAANLGLTRPGVRCSDCEHAAVCPFHRVSGRGEPAEIEAARQAGDGYVRDLCVFRPAATIPDSIHMLVEYENGVVLNYQLEAFGKGASTGVIYGTHGSMDTNGVPKPRVTPYYGEPYEVTPPPAIGGHGGGDVVMFDDIFNPEAPSDPLLRMSTHQAGAWSALIGIAANQSIRTGQPVLVRDLVRGLECPAYATMRDEPEGFETAMMRAWVDSQDAAKRKPSVSDAFEKSFHPDLAGRRV